MKGGKARREWRGGNGVPVCDSRASCSGCGRPGAGPGLHRLWTPVVARDGLASKPSKLTRGTDLRPCSADQESVALTETLLEAGQRRSDWDSSWPTQAPSGDPQVEPRSDLTCEPGD